MALGLGQGFTLVLTESGDICGFGSNEHGELGTRIENEVELDPVTLTPWNDFARMQPVMLAATHRHAACVTDDGSVWTWGDPPVAEWNNIGGGTDATYTSRAPWRIRSTEFGRSKAVMVACGMNFTVMLTAAGHVWNCGLGKSGELGHGDNENKRTMTLLNPSHFGDRKITLIAAGYLHTMAYTSDGNLLYTWGQDRSGIGFLGRICTVQEQAVPAVVQNQTFGGAAVASMDASLYMSSVVTVDGVLWSCGNNYDGALGLAGYNICFLFVRVGGPEMFGGSPVRHVACGHDNSLILAENGRVWCTGEAYNVDGNANQLIRPLSNYHGFQNSHVTAVACGSAHCALVRENGTVFTWGNGLSGNLCHGDREGVNFPQPVSRMSMLGGQRVGRWHTHDPQRALAFGMGTHGRLGNYPRLARMPSEIVRLMFRGFQIVPHPHAGPGLQRLMGFPGVVPDEVPE